MLLQLVYMAFGDSIVWSALKLASSAGKAVLLLHCLVISVVLVILFVLVVTVVLHVGHVLCVSVHLGWSCPVFCPGLAAFVLGQTFNFQIRRCPLRPVHL